jgi:hypothetical protein
MDFFFGIGSLPVLRCVAHTKNNRQMFRATDEKIRARPVRRTGARLIAKKNSRVIQTDF